MSKNVFAFHMSMNPKEESSEMTLGDWDESKYTGNLNWYDVVHRKFWSITLDDVLVNGKSLGLCTPDRNCLVTPDSGTATITFPSWAFNKFEKEYGASLDCDEGWEYKQGDMTFVIGGKNYSVPSHHWNQREKTKLRRSGKDGECSTSITPLDIHMPGLDGLFIVGDLFMQMYYTVYDRDNDRVGFANAVHTACEAVYHWNQHEEVEYVDYVC